MAINKVKFGNQTLIDLTDTTATADKILTGFGAYGKDGVWMDGSLVPGADDGYVYQDEDNYVVLDDDEGVGVGVIPLTVTENGTYNAGTRRAYNPVTVNVPERAPKFTAIWYNDYSGVKEVVCNKTYQEVYNYVINDGQELGTFVEDNESRTDPTPEMPVYLYVRVQQGVDVIRGIVSGKIPYAQINYYSNGGITFSYDEINSLQTLSVTRNGTYTPGQDRVISEVTVNVQPSLIAKTVTPTAETQIVLPTEITEVLISDTLPSISSAIINSNGMTKLVTLKSGAVDIVTTFPNTYRLYLSTVNRETLGGGARYGNGGMYIIDEVFTMTGTAVNVPSNNPWLQDINVAPVTNGLSVTFKLEPTAIAEHDGTRVFILNPDATFDASTGWSGSTDEAWRLYNLQTTTYDGLSQVTVNGDADLVAGNIKKDVEIFGVTGTYEGGKTYSATITSRSTGDQWSAYARYPSSSGTKYYTRGDTFGIEAGEIIYLYAMAQRTDASIYVNGTQVAYSSAYAGGTTSYNYTVPANTNVSIQLSYGTATYIYVTEEQTVIDITENGLHNVSEYDYANVNILPVTEKDVNFYDYDGTLLYSYTAQEFAQLSALPPNPSHTGLIAHGWNWALSDAKEYLLTAGSICIGQMYVTDDGKTRIYVRIKNNLTPTYRVSRSAGTVTVNWGDNSEEEQVSTTTNLSHTYPQAGEYIITFSGGTLNYDGSSYSYSICPNVTHAETIEKVELGTNISKIGRYMFYSCCNLQTITVPSNISGAIGSYTMNHCRRLKAFICSLNNTQISDYAFQYCYSLCTVCTNKLTYVPSGGTFDSCSSLQHINYIYGTASNYSFRGCSRLKNYHYAPWPDTVTNAVINQYAFSRCYALQNVTLAPICSSIGRYAFQNCYCLTEIELPASVTSIEAGAFYGCDKLFIIRLLSTTPPTLANTNALSNLPTAGKIYVPRESLEAYQTATNWSTYASRMVGE